MRHHDWLHWGNTKVAGLLGGWCPICKRRWYNTLSAHWCMHPTCLAHSEATYPLQCYIELWLGESWINHQKSSGWPPKHHVSHWSLLWSPQLEATETSLESMYRRESERPSEPSKAVSPHGEAGRSSEPTKKKGEEHDLPHSPKMSVLPLPPSQTFLHKWQSK